MFGLPEGGSCFYKLHVCVQAVPWEGLNKKGIAYNLKLPTGSQSAATDAPFAFITFRYWIPIQEERVAARASHSIDL
jgi:hypothetical protein